MTLTTRGGARPLQVTPGGGGGGQRFSVLAVTPSRLYFFAGGPSLEAAAQLAVSLAGAAGLEPVVELPGRLAAAALHVYGKPGRRPERCEQLLRAASWRVTPC